MRLLTSALLLLGLSTIAHASNPSLGSITPRGGQRGSEMAILFNGANLADAKEVLFYSPGFTVTKLEVVNANQVKVTAKIAPDCRMGEHAMRVRCESGFSEMRTFWVGPFPTVVEVEPNSDFAVPQKVSMNVTVEGNIANEDVDYYAVEAKKGQRISAEVEAMRLGTAFFDPYIAILDSKRFELGTSDDSPLLKQDGKVSVVAPADGVYIVQVRETSYGAGATYRLHIGTFPSAKGVIPAGGKAGDEVEVRFLGDPTGELKQKIKLPAAADPNFGVFAQDANGISPSPLPFRVSDFPNVLEVEPNNAPPQATPGALPAAFNGIVDAPGDVDFFKFSAKKGQVFDVHCFARRMGSPLDPVMTLSVFNGGGLVGNDDAVGPDSFFRVTIPNDGDYVIQVSDHLGKGGPDYFYRIEFLPVAPSMTVSIPKVAQYSQERQSIAVPRGNRFATLVSVGRTDFGGDLVLTPEGLPEKLTFATENMLASQTLLPIVFEAPADAPIGGKLTTITAKHIDPNIKFPSRFSINAEYIISAPGQSIYWQKEVNQVAIGVTKEVPFKIDIVQPKVPLVHGGSMNLKVVATRKEGFKAPITVSMLYNPPGVGSATNATIPEGQNEITIPLNANGGAPVRVWKIAVVGVSNVENGPVWVSSQLANLEISPPYVAFAIERAAVEQGKETQMFCKITANKPFPGNAKVNLIGLPAMATTQPLEFNKDTKEIAFPIKTDLKTPNGTHKNIFCQVVITENGEPIVQSAGGSELRVDVPIPPKVAAPMPMPTPMPVATPMPMPMAPPMKRLSRLEQLRLEQQEREKAELANQPKK